MTRAFLARAAERLATEGTRVLALIRDADPGQAPWHVSREIGAWIGEHSRRARRDGGCRLPRAMLVIKRAKDVSQPDN